METRAIKIIATAFTTQNKNYSRVGGKFKFRDSTLALGVIIKGGA